MIIILSLCWSRGKYCEPRTFLFLYRFNRHSMRAQSRALPLFPIVFSLFTLETDQLIAHLLSRFSIHAFTYFRISLRGRIYSRLFSRQIELMYKRNIFRFSR